jgi:hypothetical protein
MACSQKGPFVIPSLCSEAADGKNLNLFTLSQNDIQIEGYGNDTSNFFSNVI